MQVVLLTTKNISKALLCLLSCDICIYFEATAVCSYAFQTENFIRECNERDKETNQDYYFFLNNV